MPKKKAINVEIIDSVIQVNYTCPYCLHKNYDEFEDYLAGERIMNQECDKCKKEMILDLPNN